MTWDEAARVCPKNEPGYFPPQRRKAFQVKEDNTDTCVCCALPMQKEQYYAFGVVAHQRFKLHVDCFNPLAVPDSYWWEIVTK